MTACASTSRILRRCRSSAATATGHRPGSCTAHQLLPPSNNLDNGIFLRANGTVYGPSHNVGGRHFSAGLQHEQYSGPTPANPLPTGRADGDSPFGITNGPQMSIEYRYLRPYDFVTISVTLVIPNGYAVSAANPVRYYHAIDTYLGGSDNGCGVTYVDAAGNRVVGTYPPASGTTCPSSTSIPSGVTIVESFRERSGHEPFPATARRCGAISGTERVRIRRVRSLTRPGSRPRGRQYLSGYRVWPSSTISPLRARTPFRTTW